MKIALIHNLKPEKKADYLPADYYSECDSSKTVQAITGALRAAGHTILPVEANKDLPRWLKDSPVDLAFNIAEGFQGESREARVPALLELMEIPFTGSGVLALALALDKARSKQLFRFAGVPTPNFQLFNHPDEPLDKRLHFPLIVKPNREGSAKGIWVSSVVQDEASLRAQIKKVQEMYCQEILVEEYIDGLELTIGILGADPLPVLEIDFSECRLSGEFFYSWRMKEYQGSKELHLIPRFWCPARLSKEATQAVQAVSLKAARAVGYRDIARVDIRLTPDGIPYVLEVNPLPGLDPAESNFPLMAKAGGIAYETLLEMLVRFAMERHCEARSSIPLSEVSVSAPEPPRNRALPGSKEAKASKSPADAVVALRRTARPGDPKEEDLGR